LIKYETPHTLHYIFYIFSASFDCELAGYRRTRNGGNCLASRFDALMKEFSLAQLPEVEHL
jgi:hypothetical protein